MQPFASYYSSVPPCEAVPAEPTPSSGRLYFDWFVSTKAGRLEHLFQFLGLPSEPTREAVFQTAGQCMNTHKLTEPVAPETLAVFRETMKGPIDIAPKWQLRGDVLRFCLDLGSYFGDQLISAASEASWLLWLESRRDSDYGHPVVMGRRGVPSNPIAVCIVCAYKSVKGEDAGVHLKKSFDANLDYF